MSRSGRVKFFDNVKGWGFIAPADCGGDDVFVHRSDCMGGLPQEGDLVRYEVEENARRGKRKAVEVTGGTGADDLGSTLWALGAIGRCQELAQSMRSLKTMMNRRKIEQQDEDERAFSSLCTGQTILVPVDDVYFSQDSISGVFSGGDHAGRSLNSLVEDLLSGAVSKCDEHMILDVVYYSGCLRSLNNRRLWCLKEHARRIMQVKCSSTAARFRTLSPYKPHVCHGSRVMLVNLQSSRGHALNGKLGTVRVRLDGGRWLVELDVTSAELADEPLSMKESNLVLVSSSEETPFPTPLRPLPVRRASPVRGSRRFDMDIMVRVWPLRKGVRLSSGREVVQVFAERFSGKSGVSVVVSGSELQEDRSLREFQTDVDKNGPSEHSSRRDDSARDLSSQQRAAQSILRTELKLARKAMSGREPSFKDLRKVMSKADEPDIQRLFASLASLEI